VLHAKRPLVVMLSWTVSKRMSPSGSLYAVFSSEGHAFLYPVSILWGFTGGGSLAVSQHDHTRKP
jgi:hypothetical protein